MTDLLLDTELTEDQRDCLETVKFSGDALLTVINDILDFSKIEAGKIELERIDFNLHDCLEEALKPFTVRAEENGLELLCDIAPDVPEAVSGDSGRLRQIILNLVSNAVKFTARGQVSLHVEVEPGTGASSAHLLRFTVADTGIGIPAEKNHAALPGVAQYSKDWALAGRYDFNQYIYAKAEQHFIDGTAIGSDTDLNPNGPKPDTRLTTLKIGFSF